MRPELLEEVSVKDKHDQHKNLIIYNDDVNTFDFVIETLIEICEHNPVQAEQCTWIIHHNGKCQVKTGSFKKLKPLCEALLERGLSATIED